MQRRVSTELVRKRLRESPAVALVGPRQSGKTTLARALGGAYFDAEIEEDRLRLDLAWPRLVAGRRLVVIDEAQSWPDLFPRLRAAIDADRTRRGRFLLLGSISPALMRHVTESLAGRLALVELTPFLLDEVGPAHLERLWTCGGFPDGGVLAGGGFPRWQIDYLTLLAQRDLPLWGLPARAPLTLRLLRMLAQVHGQQWNASEIGASLGLSYHTVDAYLDVLAGAFLVRRLLPWHGNARKRLVKRPKVYLRDSGLVHALLGARSPDDVVVLPRAGATWEGFAIEQILGCLAARGVDCEPSYLRTSDGYEVDLVVDAGGARWAFEFKLTSAPSLGDFARLRRAAEICGATRRVLVSRVPRPAWSQDEWSCDLPSALRRLRQELARRAQP
ncbi:MAG: ATP-binding protein [Deltaproteobacteria bacterium]|nr:ATP-binding protein [Deltaproteobacteria bacterium]